MKEKNITQKLLTMALNHSFVFHDQDAINLVCDGDIKILDKILGLAVNSQIC